jgi:hypothetical protein
MKDKAHDSFITNKREMETNENMEWEKEAPTLAALPRITPYRVPDSYFNDLTAQINTTIFLTGITQQGNSGFTVPANYFEELGVQIESRIALEQLKSLTTANGFTTPVNYFDKLQANILSQTSTAQQETKIVRLWHTDLMKYASAVCFIILAASGLYFNQQNNITEKRNTELANEQLLYNINESVIIEHIQESQTATNTSASDTEMEKYILDHYSSNDLSNNL